MFAPSPLLTVTIEPAADRPEVHLHPGGQGYWVARLASTLGTEVTFCCALGGESGWVLQGLLAHERLIVHPADAATANGVYVHDRRGGSRTEVVAVDSHPLGRHATDELYGMALGAGLDADVTLVTGSHPSGVIDADAYRRLVRDLRANGKLVIADLTGPELKATLAEHIELLKISAEELIDDGYAERDEVGRVVEGARRLCDAGAGQVLVSRASAPAVLVERAGAGYTELTPPVFEALDPSGAGDSMFAATGVALARGTPMLEALRLGMAAGALNATRRGLGSGTRQEIERLAHHVTVRSEPAGRTSTTEPAS